MSTIQVVFYIAIAVLALLLSFCALYTWAYERGARSTMWVEPMGVHDPTPLEFAAAENKEDLATAEIMIQNLELNPIDPSVWDMKPGRVMLLPPSRDEEIERLNDEVQRQSKLKSRYWRMLQEDRKFIHTMLFSQRESDWDNVPKYWANKIIDHRTSTQKRNKEIRHDVRTLLQANQ